MKIEIGKVYHVLFTDHAVNSPDSIPCEIFGRLISATNDALIFSHWELLAGDEDMRDGNRETCTLVRSAIKRIYELEHKTSKKKCTTERKHKKTRRKIGLVQDDGRHAASEDRRENT